jgi:hypothetical protein
VIIYIITYASSFILGFFVMSAGPVGFQYAAEVSLPAPESASQGLLMWVGQISGALFVAGMSMRHNHFIALFMHAYTLLAILLIILIFLLKESPVILTEAERFRNE